MKQIIMSLCLTILTTTLFASDPNISSWSKEVNEIQAQITMKEAQIVNGTRIISTYLTLRNVSNTSNPIKLDWDKTKITFCVVDEKGNELPKDLKSSYDGEIVDTGVLVLPYDSTLTFRISRNGLGIPKGKAALLDFGPWNGWVIDKADKKYFFIAVLTVEDNGKPENEGYWHGKIEIPKAEIPLAKSSGETSTNDNRNWETTLERVEIRDPNSKVITTFKPENRDLFLLFAECIAKEYKLSMHTTQLNDGVVIELGPRPIKNNSNNQAGLDREVLLTVSNGNIRRIFRFNESEIKLRKIEDIWLTMGYEVGLSTGGDKWYISRNTYVPPEAFNKEFGATVQNFISASIGKNKDALKELFSERVGFPSKTKQDSITVLNKEEAAEQFVKEYPAKQIYVLQWSSGTEGQSIVYLAAENENPLKANWCIILYAEKENDKYLFTQFQKTQNPLFRGEDADKDK
jgi:hypothetical protein